MILTLVFRLILNVGSFSLPLFEVREVGAKVGRRRMIMSTRSEVQREQLVLDGKTRQASKKDQKALLSTKECLEATIDITLVLTFGDDKPFPGPRRES